MPVLMIAVNDGREDVRVALLAITEELICTGLGDPNGNPDAMVAATAPAMGVLILMLRDESPTVLKRAIQSCTKCCPVIFRLLCTSKADISIWNSLIALKTRVQECFEFQNDGIRAHVIKFLQMIVLQQSYRDNSVEDVSPNQASLCLDICPENHPYLSRIELEIEGTHSAAIITAIINSFFPILKSRPNFTRPILEALIDWDQNIPPHLTSLQLKCVERTIRNELNTVLNARIQEAAPYRGRIRQFLDSKKRDYGSNKRAAPSSSSVEPKRHRFDEDVPPPPPPMPAQMDFNVEAIPLPIIVELILHTVNSTPQDRWDVALQQYRNVLLSIVQASALPPPPPPPVVPNPSYSVPI
ncbi:hypothetical protein HDU76_008366, partial [Blyttiomyces sp. JEL0837]